MPKQDESNWGRLAAVGLEVAVGVCLGAAVGTWVDRRNKTDPWGLVIGAGVGFAAGIYLLLKETLRANKD
jgi:F0F1-type ATP synthase assembly protein I